MNIDKVMEVQGFVILAAYMSWRALTVSSLNKLLELFTSSTSSSDTKWQVSLSAQLIPVKLFLILNQQVWQKNEYWISYKWLKDYK